MRKTRPISWIKAAHRDFEAFPAAVQEDVFSALTIMAEGSMPGTAKPLKGFAEGVHEISIRFRGDAFRVVQALKIGPDIFVIHAFQKKSKSGIKTPGQEIELVRQRLKRLKESLGNGR
jgi:phage-related protein